MRLLTPTVLLLSLPFFAASCSSDSERNASAGDVRAGILHVYRSESFDGWVLDSAAAYATYQTHAAVMEPLVRFASDGFSVEPGLAESWEYDADSFTWTFTLRPDARFSNGEPVTSDDVVFSFGIWSKGINFGGSFDRIVDAVALDERTVRFVLAAPGNTVPALLSGSIAGVMPADFAGMTEDAYYAAPIGAGPYVVNDWSSGGRIKLLRNPHYYAPGRPSFDEIVIDVVSSDTELAILFESGQADIVNNVSATAASQYAASGIVVTPASQVSHLSLNVRAPPFDDVTVRRAVASALDYDGIVNGPFEGYASLPNGFLPPNLANWAPASTSVE
jgi:peptide/nickel transport system substrate-binding protein